MLFYELFKLMPLFNANVPNDIPNEPWDLPVECIVEQEPSLDTSLDLDEAEILQVSVPDTGTLN